MLGVRVLFKVLIQKCFDAATQNGYHSMYLETMPELSTAVGLYQQLGFNYLQGPLGNSGHFLDARSDVERP